MKQFIINCLEAVSLFMIFAVTFLTVYAGSFVLDDGLGGSPVPGLIGIFTGLFFFAVIINAVIDSVCAR